MARELDMNDWLDRQWAHILGVLFGYEKPRWFYPDAFITLAWHLREVYRAVRG